MKLGDYAKDTMTGFAGIITAQCDYLTGCRQFCIQPEGLDKDGQPQKSLWIDEGRVTKSARPGGPQANCPGEQA